MFSPIDSSVLVGECLFVVFLVLRVCVVIGVVGVEVFFFSVWSDSILCRGCGNWLFCWGGESGFIIISCSIRIDNCAVEPVVILWS